MRIVVVSAWEPWRTSDGAAFVLDHQLRRLALRHEVTLLAAGAPVPEVSPVPDVAGRYGEAAVSWFGSELSPAADYLWRLAWSARSGEPAHVRYVERAALLQAYDDALQTGPDLVHLHGWGTARLAERAGADGVPAVHVAIDPWATNFANRRLPGLRRVLDRGQLARVARHEQRHYPAAKAVVVVTDADAEAVRAAAPEATVEVIPNGVEPGSQPLPPAADPPVLGFHGVFDSQANVDAAITLVRQILPKVQASVPSARVLLVGRRPPREVRELAGGSVELRADVDDLRTALLDMSVHVDWMTSGAGIKNKVLEAMAAARPVVASAAGAQGIGAGPGLVVSADIDAAAAEAARLLRDEAALRRTGAAARDRVVADFSWDRNAAALEQLWMRVAGAAVG
ncbi:MAG TPA: glycosyltransferase family 4 protein [Mycobacteriales bacterium]|nr:glycosyltransferase family 4 protein [Mycobacteriales bacterium]